MAIREIPVPEWERFLTDFGRGHRAWLTTVERFCGGDLEVAARTQSLDAVRSEVAGDRVIGIAIEFQRDSPGRWAVRVDAPVKLRVDETEEGRVRALEIEDARGGCTRVGFRAAPPLEALDGLAPGERLESGLGRQD